ncbi:MAG: 4Fe-4S binding protein [Candidatus Edwardsbacteria bacterium]
MPKQELPKIDLEKCDGDGTCVDSCPMQVLEIVDGKAKVVRPDDCTACTICVDACPQKAIVLEEMDY